MKIVYIFVLGANLTTQKSLIFLLGRGREHANVKQKLTNGDSDSR